MPAIWALAGLVPWADLGIRQTWSEKKNVNEAGQSEKTNTWTRKKKDNIEYEEVVEYL